MTSTDSTIPVNGILNAKVIEDLLKKSKGFLPADHKTGPILQMHKIDFRELGEEFSKGIKNMLLTLIRSPHVLDTSPDRTSINCGDRGAMRQIHANAPAYLPKLTRPATLSFRAKLYDDYVRAFKHHSAGRGGGAETTGYVEYTASDANYREGANFRIVFDYYYSRVYFTPLHYASWAVEGGRLKTVDKPPANSDYPNPFFWITDIQ